MPEGVTSDKAEGSVTSGTASDALIKAAMASESSEPASSAGGSTGSQAGTGDTTQPGGTGPASTTAEQPVTGSESKPGAAGQPKPTGTEPRGEAPESRIQAAVRNARAGVITQIADALGLEPRTFGTQGIRDIKTAFGLVHDLRTRPQDFLASLAQDLGYKVVKADGAALDLADESYPDADLQTPDGSRKAYSDAAVKRALEIQRAQILRDVDRRLGPLARAHQERQQHDEEEAAYHERLQTKDTALAEARKLPHFKENENLIAQHLAAMDPALRRRVGVVAAMHMAYGQVLDKVVLPALKTKHQQEHAEALRRKANAGDGIHPAGSGGDGKAPALKDGDLEGLAAHMRRLHEMASTA